MEDGACRPAPAALGELGNDLSTTADETLITTGAEAGDAEIVVYAEEDSRSRSLSRTCGSRKCPSTSSA